MSQHPTCTTNAAPDSAARCQECGTYGASPFGDMLLCPDGYVGKGSCCPEFGKDDLWKAHEKPPQQPGV